MRRQGVTVKHAAVRGIGRLRLLLIAAAAVGVVQMHVFGHTSPDHGVRQEPAPAAATAVAAPGRTADAGPDGTPATDGLELSFDLLAVCLAILTSAGIAAAVVVRLVRSAGPGSGSAGYRVSWRRFGRRPPLPVPPLGYRLASGAVLRI